MPTLSRYLFAAMWLSWVAYWWISSRKVKRTVRRESLASRLSYICPLLLAALFFAVPRPPVPVLGERFLPAATWSFVVAAALTAAGLLFAVWARRYLGPNWSATLAIKEGHELITTGPYAIVRHPIYAGLVLAIVGSAMAIGEWRALLGAVIAVLAFVRKFRLEERWMHEQFGEAYRTYRQRVPALIPFIV